MTFKLTAVPAFRLPEESRHLAPLHTLNLNEI